MAIGTIRARSVDASADAHAWLQARQALEDVAPERHAAPIELKRIHEVDWPIEESKPLRQDADDLAIAGRRRSASAR